MLVIKVMTIDKQTPYGNQHCTFLPTEVEASSNQIINVQMATSRATGDKSFTTITIGETPKKLTIIL